MPVYHPHTSSYITANNSTCGDKRVVKNLSMDQRARKRANDRVAQRNIRQRTKEHVEFLEEYIKFLGLVVDADSRSSIGTIAPGNGDAGV
jgi:predicted enzyme involved in methoxymalonyl-ACP biosynthesis